MITETRKILHFDEIITRHAANLETPHQELSNRRILLVAGVNGAGKSAPESLFPTEMVHGMSAAFMPDIVKWWNNLLPEQREDLVVEKVPGEWRRRFTRTVGMRDFIPDPNMPASAASLCYECKRAFGKIISDFLQQVRDPQKAILHRPGRAHAVAERIYMSTLHLQNVVITGMRPLADFEYFLKMAGESEDLGLLYIDADRRMAGELRGESERDLVKFRHDLLELFSRCGWSRWVLDNNDDEEAYHDALEKIAPELRAFVRLN